MNSNVLWPTLISESDSFPPAKQCSYLNNDITLIIIITVQARRQILVTTNFFFNFITLEFKI